MSGIYPHEMDKCFFILQIEIKIQKKVSLFLQR